MSSFLTLELQLKSKAETVFDKIFLNKQKMCTIKDLEQKPFSWHKESRHKPAVKSVFPWPLHRHTSPRQPPLCRVVSAWKPLLSFPTPAFNRGGQGSFYSQHIFWRWFPISSHYLNKMKKQEGEAKTNNLAPHAKFHFKVI